MYYAYTHFVKCDSQSSLGLGLGINSTTSCTTKPVGTLLVWFVIIVPQPVPARMGIFIFAFVAIVVFRKQVFELEVKKRIQPKGLSIKSFAKVFSTWKQTD